MGPRPLKPRGGAQPNMIQACDMLNTITHGTPTDLAPLLIVHGLFGSARNWGVIAKRLSDTRQVVAIDMRNHGDSPAMDSHSYADMAADIAQNLKNRDFQQLISLKPLILLDFWRLRQDSNL